MHHTCVQYLIRYQDDFSSVQAADVDIHVLGMYLLYLMCGFGTFSLQALSHLSLVPLLF